MEVKELRIGNWVIDADDDDRLLKIPTGEDIDFATDYRPIPLTEEWLLKFGLHKPYDQFYWTFNNKDSYKFKVHFKEGGVECYVYWDGGFIGYFKYVHQLQNLYFALTGKELEMKTDV